MVVTSCCNTPLVLSFLREKMPLGCRMCFFDRSLRRKRNHPQTFLLHIFSLNKFRVVADNQLSSSHIRRRSEAISPDAVSASQMISFSPFVAFWWTAEELEAFRSNTMGITDLSSTFIIRRNISQKTWVCTKQFHLGNGLSNSFTINNCSLTWIQLRCDFHLWAVFRQEKNQDQPINRRIRHPGPLS